MKMSNDFDDYCNNTQCPLIAKVDWSKPMLSWFIMRYNGFIVKRGANEKPILSFAVNKDGYSFQSKKGVYIWKNSNYHDTGTFGLPGGYLLDAEGSTVATATGCSTNPLSSYNCVTYNLFNVESDANAYKIKLEIEMHLGIIKKDVHLCMYDNDELIFNTKNKGHYNEIFILRENDNLPVIFSVFCSFFLNLSWGDL